MDKDKLEKMRKRLLVSFLEELPEHIEALNRDLLALEKNPSAEERTERITTLFRTMHTLKGAARSANLSLLEEVGQRLEDLLEPVRAGTKELGPELVSVLFAAADAIEEAGMR